MIFLLVGPSAVGKTSIENELDMDRVTIYTSREKREIDDGYIHCTVDEITDNEDLIVYAKLSDEWIYAVSTKELQSGKNMSIAIITNKAAIVIQNLLKELSVDYKTVMLLVPRDIRVKRMVDRNDSEESISARLAFEDDDVNNETLNVDYINRIYNYKYKKDFDEVIEFINTNKG